ncbi:MAG: hypothetical protein LHV69_07430, partial [Elusimicrobia bacterium]|nr:hypothetical protein [Candidatus Obscuribacterium magneticum]
MSCKLLAGASKGAALLRPYERVIDFIRTRFKTWIPAFAGMTFLITSVLCPLSSSFAETKTWLGTGGDANWNTDANWSPSGVPQTGDDVVFDGTSQENCAVQSTPTVVSLSVNTGYSTGTITFTSSMVVTGKVSLATGTVNLGSVQLVVQSSWSRTGGTFDPGTSTVTFAARDGTFTILMTGASFYNLVITTETAAATYRPQDELYVLGDLTIERGTFDNDTYDKNITVAGNVTMDNNTTSLGDSTWTVSGNFDYLHVPTLNRNSSTLILTGSNKLLIGVYNDLPLNNLQVSGSVTMTSPGTGTKAWGNVVIIGTVTVDSGMMTLRLGTLRVKQGGLITGNGTLEISGMSLLEQEGTINCGQTWFDEDAGPIVPSRYDSPKVIFMGNTGGANSLTLSQGTYDFSGDVYFSPAALSYTVDNSVNNPTLIFRKNLYFNNYAGPLIWKKGNGSIAFSSSSAQTADFFGKDVENIISSNTASDGLTFVSSFTTPSLYVNAHGLGSAATIYFAGNSTFTISTFTVNGSATYPVVLKSTDSNQWYLNVAATNTVFGVQVASSNAIGATIYAANSLSLGNNNNWVFGQSLVWDGGGADNNCSTADNWNPNQVPTPADDILLDSTSNKALTWDAACPKTVNSWTQTMASTATVTFGTTYDSTFSTFTVTTNVNLSSGIWTHTDNSTAETNRLYVVIGGSLTVGANALITADGLGYDLQNGPGWLDFYEGAAYGGIGGDGGGDGSAQNVYGSFTAPVNLGSGGENAAGGGAITLIVAGTSTVNGVISCNGEAGSSYAGGSGGSIYLKSGGLTGDGKFQTDGAYSQWYGGGGGGRVAVILTGPGTDFTLFTGTLTAYGGGGGLVERDHGAAGTVYLEDPADGTGRGHLIIDNNNLITYGWVNTPLPTPVNFNDFAEVVIRNKGNLAVTSDDTLNWGSFNYKANGAAPGFITLVSTAGVTFSNPLVISSVTLNADSLRSFTGNVVISSGGALSHSKNGTAETYKLNLSINGDLTVQAGGSVDVSSMGYANWGYVNWLTGKSGPGGVNNYDEGGGHGGVGGAYNGSSGAPVSTTYGSLTAPIELGSGGGYGGGGGAAILTVTGTTTANGSLNADGEFVSEAGAGGSIYLITGWLNGGGSIMADGGDGGSCYGAGGGGRVSVKLTGAGAGFGSFTGAITAAGGKGCEGAPYWNDAAAGTVYLEDVLDGAGNGELIIDNPADRVVFTGITTLVSELVTDTVVGTVTIRNAGILDMSGSTTTLTVKGGWNLEGDSAQQILSDGSVVFAGTNAQVVQTRGQAFNNIIASNTAAGGLTFVSSFSAANLSVNTADLGSAATIYFAGGSTLTIAQFDAQGTASFPVVLKSTDSKQWYLTAAGALVSRVQVSSSNASYGITIYAGANSTGANTANWVFGDAPDTGVRYWVASSTGYWANAANWSFASGGAGGAPIPSSTHTVVFTAGRSGNCLVDTNVAVATITISGYTGTFNSQSFDVTISSYFGQTSGTVALGTSVVTLQGNLTRTGGAFNVGTSTLSLTGSKNQILTLMGDPLSNLEINKSGGTASIGETDLTLNGGFTLTAGNFTAPTGVMTVGGRFANTGGSWNANNGTLLLVGNGAIDMSGGGTLNQLNIGSGLVGYWKFDDGSGTSAKDSASGGYNATLYNTPTWVAGSSSITFANPKALSFNGTNEYGRVLTESPFDFERTSSFTITMWINRSNSGDWQCPFDKHQNNSTSRGYSMEIYADILWFSLYSDYGGGNWLGVWTVNSIYGIGVWQHVAVTYDGTSQASGVKIYINGVLQPVTVYADNLSGTILNNTTPYIGMRSDSSEYFPGQMDDLRVYNRVLSAAEVQTLAGGYRPDYTLASNIDVNGDLALGGGELDAGSNYSITVASSWVNNGGAFVAQSGQVTLDGASGSLNLHSCGSPFNQLTFNGGATWSLGSTLTVSGLLNLSAGTLDVSASTYAIAVGGGWTDTGSGSFTERTGTVTFTGAGTINSNEAFQNVVIYANGNTVSMGNNLDVNGILTISSGTLDTSASNYGISVANDWAKTSVSTFTAHSSTVTFDGGVLQKLTGATTFYGLTALTSGTTLQFTAGTTQYVTGLLNLQNIYLRSTTSGSTWYLSVTSAVTQNVQTVDVKDSNALPGVMAPIYAANSTDSGNNRNWVFMTDTGKRYWVASGPGNWNDASNWSFMSGVSGGASVPTSTHTVYFDGAGGKNGNCTVNEAINIGTLTVSGYTGTIYTSSFSVTISSHWTQGSGLISLGTSAVQIGGNFSRTGGTFDAGTSTFTFKSGSGTTRTILTGGASFYNLVFDRISANPTFRPQDDLYVLGDLWLKLGTFDNATYDKNIAVAGNVTMDNGTTSMGDSTWTVSGNWNHSAVGTFNANQSLVKLVGSGKKLNTFYNKDLYDLEITGAITVDDADSSYVTVSHFAQVSGALTMNNSRSLEIVGDLQVAGTGVIDGDGGVDLNGGALSQMDGAIRVSQLIVEGDHLANVVPAKYQSPIVKIMMPGSSGNTYTFRGQSGTYWFTGDVTFDGSGNNVTVIDDATNDPNWIFEGDVTFLTVDGSSLTWTKGTGTITFSSNTAQVADFAGMSVENIISSNTSSNGLTFSSSFTTPSLWVNASGLGSAATIYFAGNSTFTISTFTVNGDATYPVVLKSTDTSQWYLHVTSSQTVSYVQVSSSDANGGLEIVDYPGGSNLGNNEHWTFTGPVTDSYYRYWVAAGAAMWSDAAAWSTTSGGAGGASPPTSTHTVVFDGASGKNGDCILDTDVTVATITIAGSTGTLDTNGYTVTISSYFASTTGVLQLGTSTVKIAGNWSIYNSTGFIANASTVTFNAANGSTHTLLMNGASFYHLVITTETTSATYRPQDKLFVLGNFTLQNGFFDNATYDQNVAVAGDVTMDNTRTDMGDANWTVSGNFDNRHATTFNANASTVTLTGSGKQILTGSSKHFYNLVINGSLTNATGGTLWTDGAATISGSLTLATQFYSYGDMRILNTGSIDNDYLYVNSGLSQQDGHIRTTLLGFYNGGGTVNIAAGLYESPAEFRNGSSSSDRTTTLLGGTFVFTKDVAFNSPTKTLTMNNAANNPSFVFQGDVSVSSNVIWTKGTGTINFSTNAAQEASFLGKSVEPLVSSNTNSSGLTFVSSFTTPSLWVNANGLGSAATIYFAGQSTFTISTFTVTGSASLPVVLKSTSSDQWFLKVTGTSTVTGVHVSSSNATKGNTIFAGSSVNLGSNDNWVFGQSLVWDGGGSDNNCSTANNWNPNQVPTQADDILLDGTSNKALTWDAACVKTVNSWTQTLASTATVTFGTTYGATFSTFTILNNVNLSSGIWTHQDNSTAETYRLYVVVGGSMTVLSSATITADTYGYNADQGPGKAGAGTDDGGGYGGIGGDVSGDGPSSTVYGSITAPTNLGSGGDDNTGGGAIILNVAGTATVQGVIRANGTSGSGGIGAGGSVYLTAGWLVGGGTIQAKGGVSSDGGGGGGGRVSVILNGSQANFDGFTGNMTAIGGSRAAVETNGVAGAAGTVYRQLSTEAPGTGTLIIDNANGYCGGGVHTLMPASVNLNNFSKIILRGKGNVAVDADDTLNLSSIN